jgi:hypothetical protein
VLLLAAESGEVWAAGSNGDGQLGLGRAFGDKNFDFRLVKALKGVGNTRGCMMRTYYP